MLVKQEPGPAVVGVPADLTRVPPAVTAEKPVPDLQANKGVWKQVLSCTSVMTLHFMTGVCMAYSSSLIPALEASDSEIPVTRQQSAWLASTFVLAVPVGSVLSMTLNDVLGRVTLVKMMAVPFCAGWVLMATATTFEQIVVGRLFTGVAIGLSHSPSLLFTTEVATKGIRGAIGTLATAMASFGIVMCYLMGAYLPWRTHAWANCVVPVVPLALQIAFSTESPVWLRARGRMEEGVKSSLYYYNDPDMVLSSPSKGDPGKGGSALWRQCRVLFTDPKGYKPLIVINTVFLVQQLVGVYVTIYYAVTFFAETGSTMDPYMASIYVGIVRLISCTSVSIIMTRFGRRWLMTISSIGQSVSMAVSGYATMRIMQEPGSVPSEWVVCALLAYIALGCLGWQTIPWSMMAELFPHEVRSLAQPLNSSTAHILMFGMLQLYPTLNDLMGGSAGIQFLFCGMSAMSAIFVLLFLPETRGRSLPEIEDYFRHNVTFLTEKRRRRAARLAAAQSAILGHNKAPAVV